MGCNVKEKPPRGRKHRHSSALTAGKLTVPDPNPNPPNPSPNSFPNPNPSPNPNSFDESGWGYCTEEQLEELLLKNLDYVYKEALARLISLNYDENLALRALLSNGHCYGSMDVLSNVLHNAIAFLNSSSGEDSSASAAVAFSDLRHLQEYSLAGMVCLLQQVRPHLSRGDAMWCLLMSELHVGRATTIEIPSPAAPPPCKMHADSKLISRRKVVPRSKAAAVAAETEESDIVAMVMESLENMSIREEEEEEEEEKPEDQKREMILDLVKQIRELENQVNERKEWAQQKAVQAAKKLSNDLTELKVLRMEREENQRVKKGKQALEDSTMKRLAEMEGALKKASGQVDRANALVHRLEAENAEIRAEMEACKLSAAESAATCLEVAKRERRCLKRLIAWEKQRERLQGEVAVEREGIARLQRQLEEVFVAQKEAEVKWRQETKAKERAITLVEEERRAKEAADASIKREHETLRRKNEIDFQRHKDDIHRLEEEIFRLRASAGPTQPPTPCPNTLSTGDSEISKSAKETNIKLGQGFNKPKDPSQMVNRNRECVLCMKDEVSVVFLPCAHQVVCTSCNEDHERRAKTTCPCCNAHIEERIHVYGATS
ncbi:MND1-interacting protein 1-like [Iris pallida]|uniref:MND1-interacting protein 1-like n=1 Tax=Iris pallida TaxID=29817 RepID=A0AAX6EB84_IRIPA|nr:MND1-interacting protein 1-like [Iris pallida]